MRAHLRVDKPAALSTLRLAGRRVDGHPVEKREAFPHGNVQLVGPRHFQHHGSDAIALGVGPAKQLLAKHVRVDLTVAPLQVGTLQALAHLGQEGVLVVDHGDPGIQQ